jgi:hypothetical protein
MIGKIADTSMESNLMDEWRTLVKIPWMEATLYDFYANVFCIYLWILYKEKNVWKRGGWLIFLVTAGSVATCIYLLKELLAYQPREDLKELLTKQNN